MPLDAARVRRQLTEFDLGRLFIEELGWDRYAGRLEIVVDGTTYVLEGIAEKRGMVAFRARSDDDGLPDYATRRQIERQAARSILEHLIVYTNDQQHTQVWQWVRREPGKPTACREQTFRVGQTGEALVQRLEALAFSLDEEAGLTLVDVTRRARAAFDVERITRRFYDRFKAEHDAFLGFISGLRSQEDLEWYASVMLNRLMFVYFIEKKGFLDGDRNYLRNRLQQLKADRGPDQFLSFYRHFLLRLFHEGLGQRRRNSELDSLIGEVPYLNGGLFDVHELERANPEIEIPDEAFETLFDFFDSYQWHLDDRPLRADNEVNPDVLGYIFEKYVNQKQMGAYYSKEDITEFITSNTVLPRLFDKLSDAGEFHFGLLLGLLADDPARYIHEALRHGLDHELPEEIAAGIADTSARGLWNTVAPATHGLPLELWREVVARRRRAQALRARLEQGDFESVSDLVAANLNLRQLARDVIETCDSPTLLRDIYRALETLSILDPTCGSGAFLFAALNILEPLYDGCLDRMQAFLVESDDLGAGPLDDFRRLLERVDAHANRHFFVLKTIVVNNLFGVDIMEEAVEICKLRLFLKLVSQIDRSDQLEPLPDIDFNVRAGNSLVGFAHSGEVAEAAARTLDLGGFLEDIERRMEEADRLAADFRQAQIDDDEAIGERKQTLKQSLADLSLLLDRYLATDYGVVASPDAPEFQAWQRTHQPFHWLIDFHATMTDGGFDAIIGNPPYVEYRLVRDTYRIPPGTFDTEPVGNLYAFCMERSTRLLRGDARFGMIVPAGVLGLDESLPLRQVLLRAFGTNVCSSYAIRPSKLFDGVDQRLCIYFGHEAPADDPVIFTSQYQHWKAEERPTLFARVHHARSFLHPRLRRIPQLGSEEATGVVAKLEAHSGRLVRDYFATRRDGVLLHYHRSPRYWIRAMDFEQYFRSPTRTRSVHHFRDLHFRDEGAAKAVGALLNSSLFFLWFTAVGNGRNITGTDVQLFPVGELDSAAIGRLGPLFDRLMDDYQANSFVRVRQDSEFQEFRPSLSKPIIDEIDDALAVHFGFTADEADFIKNLDVKYRVGSDDEG